MSRGVKELQKSLKQFPKNIQKNVMTGAVRAGAKPIVKRARELVPVEHGDLKKSIRIKKRRIPKGSTMLKFSIHAGGNIRVNGESLRPYYAHMIEFGTSQMSAQPFMRPALEQEAGNAIKYVREYIEKRIPKEIAKARR